MARNSIIWRARVGESMDSGRQSRVRENHIWPTLSHTI